MIKKTFALLLTLLCVSLFACAQNSPTAIGGSPTGFPGDAFSRVRTYVNPILPGDHPDPTLLKVGEDFYMCGSSFHFVPNLPILHSRDLLHWEIISRVVPADWADLKSGAPGDGVWQGAITYFYGAYHIYFSNGSGGGQYRSTASSPAGPWSVPVKVKTNSETGQIGYDNSIFVDDDGKPYMVIKSGQTTNRIQQIDQEGNMTGKLIKLDWINRDKKYSWAEGPVMCKHDGWYYYFMAGNVTGGQYILRSKILTADSTKWETMGKIFAFSAEHENRFRSTNHMSAPFQLKDGTWWCIAQSYDAPKEGDWTGQGRQGMLLQIYWTTDGIPYVPNPSDQPLVKPHLKDGRGNWRLPRSDEFNNSRLNLAWHFLNKAQSARYSLAGHEGRLRLNPGGNKAVLLQKEGGHNYTLLTKINVNPAAETEQAGIYLCSGDETVNVHLCSGFDNGKKILFVMGIQSFSIPNTIGNEVWLKLVRQDHDLAAYCSPDGRNWLQVGGVVDARDLDKAQPNFNRWVGTSMGLFAQGAAADFDFFHYKDGFSELPLNNANNYFGIDNSPNFVTTQTDKGAWLMLGGVDLNHGLSNADRVYLTLAANKETKIELWQDNIMESGTLLATLKISSFNATGKWNTLSMRTPVLNGQHDIYVKITGSKGCVALKSIRFSAKN
jgi:beta-xylosidase